MAIRHIVSGAIIALAVGVVPALAGPHHGMMMRDRGSHVGMHNWSGNRNFAAHNWTGNRNFAAGSPNLRFSPGPHDWHRRGDRFRFATQFGGDTYAPTFNWSYDYGLPSWCAGVLAHPQSHTRSQINYCMAVDGG